MIAREGLSFIIPVGGLAALSALFGAQGLSLALSGAALFTAYFFRDPKREVPAGNDIVVSPADGKVLEAVESGGTKRIAIFLSIFDVHITRAPVDGEITAISYRPGKFIAAFRPEAARENEQNELTIFSGGLNFNLKQIAGVVARRIVCWKRRGDKVGRGERIGMIRFGSRVELLLPESAEILVASGSRVRGGETIVARLRRDNKEDNGS